MDKKPFIFDEYIKKPTEELVEAQLRKQPLRRFIDKQKGLSLRSRIDYNLNKLEEGYDSFKTFFDFVSAQNYCDSFVSLDYKDNEIACFEGKKSEDFKIAGIENLVAETNGFGERFLWDTLSRKYPERIKLYLNKEGYTSISLIVPSHSGFNFKEGEEINLNYYFKTSFDIGVKKPPFSNYFTKNILDVTKDSYCKKDGVLIYRQGDGLYKDMENAIGQICFFVSRIGEKRNFFMNGSITRKGDKSHIYSGNMDSLSLFPFVMIPLDDDDDEGEWRSIKPIPTGTYKILKKELQLN